MNKGFTSNLWVWTERYKLDNREVSWEELLNECAAAGLTAVELNSDRLEDLHQAVASAGLTVSASYIGLPLHDADLTAALREKIEPVADKLASLGGTDLLVNADVKPSYVKTEDDFKRQGEHLSLIAELTQPCGIRTAMHNHAANQRHALGDLRSVIDYASPNTGLCVDTGWTLSSGCDPLDWVVRYGERVYALHLRNQFGSVPTEDLLHGDLSMPAFVQALKDARYEGWFSLELWHREDTKAKRSMLDDYRLSIEYLNSLI